MSNPSARSEEGRANLVSALSKVLADTYAIYLKTHGYHWNVRGPNFHSNHTMFEGQYQSHWAALDEIAERIRALGALAPQGSNRLANLTPIKNGDPDLDAEAMIADLLQDNQIVLDTLHEAFDVADAAGDQASIDLINSRTAAHEKHAWMLRSSLGRP